MPLDRSRGTSEAREVIMSLKFSLSRMMFLVFVVAFGLAAAIASLYKFVVIAFCTATAITMFSRGPARAFCLGFALTGWIFMTFLLGAGTSHKYAWPTMHPIDRFYRSIYPYPVTSRNYDQQSIRQLRVWIDRRKEAITNVHSLIALNLGFIGGAITWFASTRRRNYFRPLKHRSSSPPLKHEHAVRGKAKVDPAVVGGDGRAKVADVMATVD
jgi:hypothetical protein